MSRDALHYVYSSRVLLEGRFRPALVGFDVNSGRITSIDRVERRNALTFGALIRLNSFVDYGDSFIGPGLIDVGVDWCEQGYLGGVTTVLQVDQLELENGKAQCLTIRSVGGEPPRVLPNFVCVENPWSASMAKDAICIKADSTNRLASPLHGMPSSERQGRRGNQWRTGRSRRGSQETLQEVDDEDHDELKLPPEMIEIIMKRELGTFQYPEDSSSAVETNNGGQSRSIRPPPISTNVKSQSAFEPCFFLRDYEIHLSLRSREREIEGIDALKQNGGSGVLRLSTKEALESSSTLNIIGACMPHLLRTASDVSFSAVHMKLDPPLRSERDRSALVQAAIDDDRFVISSGHTSRELVLSDFERTRSNGEVMPQFLQGLWTMATSLNSPLDSFSVLWNAASSRPARFFGLDDYGDIKVGSVANLIVFDPSFEAAVSCHASEVFQGDTLKGRVIQAYVHGVPLVV